AGATVVGSTFLANQASYGGGIANQGTLSISNSTVAQNKAGVQGGGIDSRGTFSQNNVVYLNNTPNDIYPTQ
ncbi:right-handed parallel beta-helix repeat-containing protein, partial [Singulisphaera rosea]